MFKHIQHNTMEMLDTLRNFIDHMKKNATARSQMKVHKIAPCKTNEVNESDIHTSSLEQVQKLVNKDTNLV